MSHHALRRLRHLLHQTTLLTRSYVGSPEEVKAYHAAKQRALEWVVTDRSRIRRGDPTEPGAIDAAFSRHLSEPLSRLLPVPGLPVLPVSDALAALSTCQSMLRDLEPYMTAGNVVRCAERLGRILSYSEREIWLQSHSSCLLQLCELIQLGIPRYSRPDLALLVWSLGKWGPRALSLNLDADTTVQHLVWQLLERMTEHGLRGDLDPTSVSQLLEGCIYLGIVPEGALHKQIVEELTGSIEYAEGSIFTRLILSFAEMEFDVGEKLMMNIAATAETKIRAGTYPEQEIPLLMRSLAVWHPGETDLIGLCSAVEQMLERWGFPEWTLEQCTWLLESFVQLRYFPSWHMLEHIHRVAQQAAQDETMDTWVTLLQLFAQLGVRPSTVMEQCVRFVEALDIEQMSGRAAQVASILKSLSLLDCLTPDLFTIAATWLGSRVSEMMEDDQLAFYTALLHLKYLANHPEAEQSVERFLLMSCREAWRHHEASENRRLYTQCCSKLESVNEAGTPQCVTLAEGDLLAVAKQGNADQRLCITQLDSFSNVGGRITGEQVWRARLLEQFGWSVRHTASQCS